MKSETILRILCDEIASLHRARSLSTDTIEAKCLECVTHTLQHIVTELKKAT